MLPKLSSLLRHSVSKNAFALTINQASNYIIPLLLIPFLTRALGVSTFGEVAIALSAIQLCFIFTDYGFSISATHAISLNRDNHRYIERKISRIFFAKLALTSIACLTLIATPALFHKLNNIESLFFAGIISVIAQSFQPTWLFQGLEKMKNITIYNVLTKFVYAGLVISIVRGPGDATLIIYLWGLANFLGLIASLYLMYKSGFKIRTVPLSEVISEIKESTQYFWSRLAVSTYTAASTLIIGLQSPIQAAQFNVCEQIYKAAQNATSPINSALFPYMAKYQNWGLFIKVVSITAIILGLGCLFFWLFSPEIVNLVFGENYNSITPTLGIFLATTTINYLGVSFGYSAFSALNRTDIANKTVMFGAGLHLINISILYILADITAFNIAIAILITESAVMLMRLIFLVLLYKRSPLKLKSPYEQL